jgi:hypothetical protein
MNYLPDVIALMICLEHQHVIKLTNATFLVIALTLFPKEPHIIHSSLVFLPFTLRMKVSNQTTESKLAQAITSDL